jgi:hypothetical protein
MRRPKSQTSKHECAPYNPNIETSCATLHGAPSAITSSHPRDGDDADEAGLPVYCRFRDLVEAGVTTNWPQLLRMVDREGFPTGIWLSANIRVWEVAEVRRWLMNRPTARKAVPGRQTATRIRGS